MNILSQHERSFVLRHDSTFSFYAESARFTRRSTRSHRRKHDVGIHVAADYPLFIRAHHVTEAAITNLEARPSRAKSLGFAARRGRPLSHVICKE
ncbi:hypothetical protein PUN28_006427 [Cardiocondyla obscurior]|uniref:Uncharacterized protein n=1 Tax=Cardiocondyla obscurior TaxID=286306 RepID=A0AAW2GBH9_9HYME